MGLIITLIIIGVIMLFAELFILPGFGIAGIGGLVCLVGAIVLAFIHYSALTGFLVLIGVLVLCGVCLYFSLRSRTWKKLSLSQSINSKALDSPEDSGITPGMEGISISRLGPAGTARFGDKNLEVYAEKGIIARGVKIKVEYIDGMRVIVSPVKAE